MKVIIISALTPFVLAFIGFAILNSICKADTITDGSGYGFHISDSKEECFNKLLKDSIKYDYIFCISQTAESIQESNNEIEKLMQGTDTSIKNLFSIDFKTTINGTNKNKILKMDSWNIQIKSKMPINELKLIFTNNKLSKICRTIQPFEVP